MSKQAKRQSYLEVVGTDERIPVPDDPSGERAAVAAHPSFQRSLAAARQQRAEGRTTPFRELRRRLDAEEVAQRPGTLPTGRRPTTANGKVLVRLPLSVHRELIERAAAEHTSLNQLVLAYISRGLGADATSA
jgi:hypothetical protein